MSYSVRIQTPDGRSIVFPCAEDEETLERDIENAVQILCTETLVTSEPDNE